MHKTPKTKQNRPDLPWVPAPVMLPGDFPFFCSGLFRQLDTPITKLHRHDAPEIGLCHSGNGIWAIEGKILSYGPGDVILVTGDETHLAQSTPGTVSEWTWLYSDPTRLFLPMPGGRVLADLSDLSGPGFANVFGAAEHPEAGWLCARIIDEFRSGAPLHREIVRGLLYALFGYFHRAAGTRSKDRTTATESRGALERVMPAVEHVCSLYAEPLSVGWLAKLCAMSETNFRRVFTRALGRSPQSYLGSIRISMAAVELRSGGATVSDIARRCGFETLSSFNRLFRRQMGMTPREWRRGDAGR